MLILSGMILEIRVLLYQKSLRKATVPGATVHSAWRKSLESSQNRKAPRRQRKNKAWANENVTELPVARPNARLQLKLFGPFKECFSAHICLPFCDNLLSEMGIVDISIMGPFAICLFMQWGYLVGIFLKYRVVGIIDSNPNAPCIE